ncbi:MAG: hypothetical protein K9L25_11330 [Methylovulum sp.]|nr:hypothetical protein [Methylovulum sp.]
MAIYSFKNNEINEVAVTTFNNEKILERKHLQAALKNKIEVIAPNCMIISEEFSEWPDSQRRIDLLAIDKSANIVVIELKRTETGELMELQAIRYAAMVSTLTYKNCVEILNKYYSKNSIAENAEGKILEFLGWDEPQEENFALDVRIILASSDFSKELTTSVMWLNERNIDIHCVRIIPYKNGDQILIDIQQIIPLPEIETYQVKIKQKIDEQRESRKDLKDYTQYIFNETICNKRKLVLAVIKVWIIENKPKNIEELVKAFPQEIHSGGLFIPFKDANEVYQRQGIARHFLNDDELVKFSDSQNYAISNQWGKGNIEKFITRAREIGFEIEEKES